MLNLRAQPLAMRLCESAAQVQAVPRIRRPQAVHRLDQRVGQTARLAWTLGVTADDLVADPCRAVVGPGGRDAARRANAAIVGVWYATPEDAAAHQSVRGDAPQRCFEPRRRAQRLQDHAVALGQLQQRRELLVAGG